MHLLDLPLEVVLHIFAQLDPFKIAKYRRVCRSFNKLLMGHPFSNLVGLVHIGDIPNELLFCFVTPACFGERFLTKVQDHVNSVCPGGAFTKYPVNTLNAIPINPVKALDEASMFENFPGVALRRSRNFCLAGPLPSTIGSLTQLTSLNLRSDFLYGPIPRSLGDLIQLTTLNLVNTNVTGPILLELATLANLKELELQHRPLDEEMPDSFGNLVNLEVLNMSSAGLRGPIPVSFRNLVNLVELNLELNELSGTVPDIFGGMSNLQMLELNNNNLEGPIPESIGRCMQLMTLLDLSNNQLSGSVPRSFAGWRRLELLDLSGNHLEGDLPDYFRTSSADKSNIPSGSYGAGEFLQDEGVVVSMDRVRGAGA
ncbi:hypothetical protein CcCBS67573_g10667, partial [Chytriomyces confervae]